MPYSDETQTLAEIAIAMAGFAGIITALKVSSYSKQTADYARMRELLLTSLGVVFFAFIPKLSSGFAESSFWIWQIPLLAFGSYQALLMAVYFRTAGFGSTLWYEWMLMPVAIGVVVSQFVVGAGCFSQFQAEVYFAALLWLLFIAANNFAILLLGDRKSDA